MFLTPDPSLAEVPGFSREQLDALARSVELRRQQLEKDIKDYIKCRQGELRNYEQELLAQLRSMERVNPETLENSSMGNAEAIIAYSAPTELQSAQSSREATKHEPEEKAKRTKHTRVQKREKELYGLVTPVFLPLLDARDISPKKEKPQPKQEAEHAPFFATAEHATTSRDTEKSKEGRKSRREHKEMEGAAPGEPGKENQHVDSLKKPKRSTTKKSSLRQHNTSRSRRKRVSLVIDGQTVLPADTVIESALASPSSETTSASNSTTSLDEMIDPRLTKQDAPVHSEHYGAVHHSLPLPMSNHIHSSTKPLVDTPSSTVVESAHSPALRSPRSPITPTLPPSTYPHSTAIQPFLEPSPTNPASLPGTAGPDPIYADDLVELLDESTAEEGFHTYVGGLHGSGVDDVDQAGSYGYPSSLGASYLESYMQSRPLRVRMEAADKAGLGEEKKRTIMTAGKDEEERQENLDTDMDTEVGVRNVDEDDNFMGNMEGL